MGRILRPMPFRPHALFFHFLTARIVLIAVLVMLPISGGLAQELLAPQTTPEGGQTAAAGPVTSAEQAADQASAAVPPPAIRLTRKALEEQLRLIESANELDDGLRMELIKRYEAALDWLATSREARKKVAEYQAEVEQAPQLVEQAKAELAQPASEPEVEVPPDVALPQLEQLLARAEEQRRASEAALRAAEEAIKRRGDRKSELAKLIDESQQRLQDAQKQLAAPPPADETPQVTAAKRAELEARIQTLQSQLALFTAESKRWDALAELFPLRRDLAKRASNARQKEVTVWQQMVTQYRKMESERQAAEARREVQRAHPALRALAERNAQLAEQRQAIVESIAKVTAEVEEIDKLLGRLRAEFESASEKVAKAGHSTTVGLVLRNQQADLPSLRTCDRRLGFISAEMPRANLDRMHFEEERASLGDLEAAVQQVASGLRKPDSECEAPFMEQTVRELLTSKRDLLDKLVNDLDSYLADLSELEIRHRKLIEQTRHFASYIDQHVLWIQSSEFLQPRDVTAAFQALLVLAHPKPWLDVARACGFDTAARSLMAVVVLAVVAVLLALQRRLLLRIRRLCESKSGNLPLRFRPTIEALVLAGLAATQWPLLVAYLGWWMQAAEHATELGLAVGPALQYIAALLWFSEFIRVLCRSGGIAESHFNWSPYSLQVVRRETGWLTFLAVPLAAIVVYAELFRQGEWSESLGRFAFLGVMLLLLSFVHSMLGARNNVLREQIVRNSGSWLNRLRIVAYAAGIVVPAFLALLAALGYYYSAQQLAVRLQATLALVLGLVTLHATASRWFLVKRRNLAIQQARQRQQQSEATASDTPGMADVSSLDQLPDLTALHGKLQLLLAQAAIVCVLAGAWFIWSDVLPALRVLDRVVLWQTSIDVTETYEDANGNTQWRKVPRDVPTTLCHLLVAAALLIGTFVIGRNLPALLEIIILNRLPIDKGGRHAISVLLRYGVALTGIILACQTMHVGWSSVQWLAAGMTVGLGFGLQEIFANFVSGLILLFERPIRVGDVITLGDITGVVTDIRIRATTVRNWDRKELVVPNKALITGQLLNWTLSDTTNRIRFTVGVAYKSDPVRTRDILLSIVKDHPQVLDDPAPLVTLEQFGDSTLVFVVRAFVASLDVRLATIHELHTEIHRRLGNAGIEIAYPQRDINIRGLEQLLSPPAASTRPISSAEAA